MALDPATTNGYSGVTCANALDVKLNNSYERYNRMHKKLKIPIKPSKHTRSKTRAKIKEEVKKFQKQSVSIEASKQHITSKYPWRINESTFQVLDEEWCLWVALVTTTHRSERKMQELTFPIIVCEKEVFAEMDVQNLRALGEWALKQKS
jgi:hypothetical protein